MNRKHIKFLYEKVDYKTLADIALKEKENNNHRNIYYDLITKEAILYPEDDSDNIPIRPLYMRLLNNGHRLNSELSKLLTGGILYALEMDNSDILKELLLRNGDKLNVSEET